MDESSTVGGSKVEEEIGMQKKLLKFFLYSGLFFSIIVGVVFVRAFFLVDISTAPLEKEVKKLIYLVSYADGADVFHKNQKILAYSAIQKGFSGIFNYKKHLLDPNFLKKHALLFDKGGPAAYWVWKPWVIMDVLKKIPENAYVFYCDSGFMIKGDIDPLLHLLDKHHMVLMAYTNKKMFGTLGQSTKREALIKTGCDTKECFDSPLIWAGMLFMRNTPDTRHFIQTWLNYCERADLIMPVSNAGWVEHPNKHAFHHQDQSLLSITYYQHPTGIALVSDEDLVDHVFKWHHRHAGERDKESLLLQLNNGLRNWERKLIGSVFFKKVAQWVYKFSSRSKKIAPPLKVVNV